MIFVVDDEPVYLDLIREAVEQEGFRVRTFADARSALEELSLEKPELIFSDIRMPGMNGFEFKEAVDRMGSGPEIPFIFLSSLDQPAHVVRGLDLGAVDYLTKPIDPLVLRAKLRSIVRNRTRGSSSRTFRGDLAVFSFPEIVKFCESEGLTGAVDFISGQRTIRVPFRGGEIDLDVMADPDETLEKLYELEGGEFRILAAAPDFSRIADAEITEEAGEARQPDERPMGKLSGLRLLDRLFQVQTEMNFLPEEKITTIVVLDGNGVYKKEIPVDRGWSVAEIERRMETQHQEVEEVIKAKAGALAEKKNSEKISAGEASDHRFYEIFEAGLAAFQEQDYQKALDLWEEAEGLNPEDQTLKVNLKIVRTKLQKA